MLYLLYSIFALTLHATECDHVLQFGILADAAIALAPNVEAQLATAPWTSAQLIEAVLEAPRVPLATNTEHHYQIVLEYDRDNYRIDFVAVNGDAANCKFTAYSS